MAYLVRITIWTVLLSLLPMLSGCIKLKQAVTVMPDGSGKIELTFAFSDKLIDKDPDAFFSEVMPTAMTNKCKGIAAYTEPVTKQENGFTYLSYTAYFQDINDVQIKDLGKGKPLTYRYSRDGESAELTMRHGNTLAMISDYKPTPEAERAEVRKALAGMAFSDQFFLPGPVDAVEGVNTQNNTAKLELTLDNLLKGTGPIEKLKDTNQLTFTIPQITTEQATIDAFKKEFDAATVAWEARQAESK